MVPKMIAMSLHCILGLSGQPIKKPQQINRTLDVVFAFLRNVMISICFRLSQLAMEVEKAFVKRISITFRRASLRFSKLSELPISTLSSEAPMGLQ